MIPIDAVTLRRLREEPDFVVSTRYANSLSDLEKAHPDGIPVPVAARAMGLTEAQFHGRYGHIIQKLQEALGENRE